MLPVERFDPGYEIHILRVDLVLISFVACSWRMTDKTYLGSSYTKIPGKPDLKLPPGQQFLCF